MEENRKDQNSVPWEEIGAKAEPEGGEKKAETKKPKSRFLAGFVTGALSMFVVGLIVVIVILIAGYITNRLSYGNRLTKMSQIESIVKSQFLWKDDVSERDLDNGIYAGLMNALDDPYSVYYDEEEYKVMMESTEGSFCGVGMYLSQDPDTRLVKCVRPIKGSPSEEVGMMAEDILIKVDGEDITGMELDVVVSKVRGEPGTSVEITFIRDGQEKVVTITRRKIEVETVDYKMLDDNIGYLQITEFDDVTYNQFKEGIDDLNKQDMKGLILDLRGNGGGLVDSCVKIADDMLPAGLVVYMENNKGKRIDYSSKEGQTVNVPVVVLVDGGTASASEILTGALRDYKAATLVGTKTFGKGIVQDVLGLGDGTAIKYTTAKYYTPNGENFHLIGIDPDVEEPFDAELYKKDKTDNQLNKGIEVLKEKMNP